MTEALTNDTAPGTDAYHRLLADIRDGQLKPGERLTETELAKRFGMSRTPVREAIRRLESDGLVSHHARIGAVIRTLDYTEVTELYEMRAVLESTAARFAARAASDVELDELSAINDDMQAAMEASRLFSLNQQFHAVLLNAARNRFLVKSVQTVQKTMLILGPSTLNEDARAVDARAEHGAIIAALRARDETTAEATMRSHIQAAHGARLRQLRDRAAP